MAVVLARIGSKKLRAIAMNSCVLALALVAALLAAKVILERPQAFASAHEAVAQDPAFSGIGGTNGVMHYDAADLISMEDRRAEAIALEDVEADAVVAHRAGSRNRAAKSKTSARTRSAGAATDCPDADATKAPPAPVPQAPSRDLGDYPLTPVAMMLATSLVLPPCELA